MYERARSSCTLNEEAGRNGVGVLLQLGCGAPPKRGDDVDTPVTESLIVFSRMSPDQAARIRPVTSFGNDSRMIFHQADATWAGSGPLV